MFTMNKRALKNKKRKLVAIILAASLLLTKNEGEIKKRRWWVRPWLDQSRGNLNLHQEFLACSDLWSYRNFLRMDDDTFRYLLNKIKHKISKKDTKFRQCITAETKLLITIRYLATGESFRSLMYNYRVSESAISRFVPIVCAAIYEMLRPDYLYVPQKTSEWLDISQNFERQWNLPNIIGALDGKHVVIKAPGNQGSVYFNYKKQHSIVLLGMVDADYKFLYVDIGMNGRISDGGVFRESSLSKALEINSLNLPEDRPLPQRTEKIPFVVVADAAFPLTPNIMKPYPDRNMTREQRIFNYRLSRVRRVVENAFGILSNRFRVLLNVNNLCPGKVCIITQACCALHNFLRVKSKLQYISANPEDDIDPRYTFAYGLSQQCGNRPKTTALKIREEFKEYVNGCGSVPWQDEMI